MKMESSDQSYLVDYLIKHIQNENDSSLIEIVKDDIQQIKADIKNKLIKFGYIQDDHCKLTNVYCEIIDLNKKIKSLQQEIDDFVASGLLTRLKQIAFISNDKIDKLEESNQLFSFKKRVDIIHNEIEVIDQEINNKLFKNAIERIDKTNQIIDKLYEDLASNNDIQTFAKEINDFVEAMQVEIELKYQKIVSNLKDVFHSNIIIKSDTGKTIIKFSLFSMEIDYESFIDAIIKVGEIDNLMQDLMSKLNKYFVKPLFNGQQFNVELIGDDSIEITENTNPNFSKIEALNSFLVILVKIFKDTKKPKSDELLLHLGQIWSNDIFDCLINLYLKPAIPKEKSEIVVYQEKIKESEEIYKLMIDYGFINENVTSPFIEYALNIDNHFTTRMCQEYLFQAKQLVIENLHQTILVGSDQESSSNSYFPTCQVSDSIVKLINLIEKLLAKINECSEDNSKILNLTIRNICELYLVVSPIRHKKSITKLPQQTAIFYNNCMYLALTLHEIIEKNENLMFLTEYISNFRQLGNETFTKHMQIQEVNILSFLQDPIVLQYLIENANKNDNDMNDNPFEKAIHRCVMHFKLLQSTFDGVLPPLVYDKAIGTLMSVFFNEVVQRISSLDDISADAAVEFSKDFEFIYKETHKLFVKSNVPSMIPKWNKFCELKFILNVNTN